MIQCISDIVTIRYCDLLLVVTISDIGCIKKELPNSATDDAYLLKAIILYISTKGAIIYSKGIILDGDARGP